MKRWLALAALAFAMLTIGLDVTVLTVALPTMAVDLGADTAALQWFSTAYTLVLAAAMLPAGALGDRYGRKPFLLGALVLFGIASTACAFATTSGQLIVARAALGLAAAVMMPLSMAVLPTLFPDSAERARALTIWVSATAIGLPIGPIVGGFLLRDYWWGSVFLINVPMVIVGAVAVALLVPDSRGDRQSPLDPAGVALAAVAMLALTYGFVRVGQHGWTDGVALAAIVVGAVAAMGWIGWERTARRPLIDLSLFARPGFAWGTTFTVVINFAMFGAFFTVPLYFQDVLGADALGSGLRMLPLIGGLAVGARLGARAAERLGARSVITAGFAALAVALGLGAATTVGLGYWYAAIWTALLGLGMGLVMPTAMSVAMDELDPQRAGAGSALIQALRQAGGTIGVAVLGTVLATAYRAGLGPADMPPIRDGVSAGVAVAHATHDTALLDRVQTAFVHGMGSMLWVCAAMCVVGGALAAWRTPDSRRSGASESVHVG